MQEGYVKFHRKIIKWEWYQDANTFRLFFHLLMNANWKDYRYQGHEVPRGSIVIGRKILAAELGISEQSVRTALEHLKMTGEITIKSTNKFTIATIVKYNDYQDVPTNNQPTTNQQSTNNQPTTNQQLTTIEERKNIRKEEGNNNIHLPEILNTDSFKAMWQKWTVHRSEIRHKLTKSTAEGQIARLEKFAKAYGIDYAIEVIRQSIDNGWQGLFELKADRPYRKPEPTIDEVLSLLDKENNK